MRRLLMRAITTAVAVAATLGTAAQASALPVAPAPIAPVTGIPTPCATTHPWPGDDASIDTIAAALTANYGFELVGKQWTAENRESIKILWQTLDAVDCTGYLTALQTTVDGHVGINAAGISGYAWGDWSLTRTSYVTMDFSKFQRALDSGDEGRLVRLVVHEMAHVLNADRFESPDYWEDFGRLYAQEGRFSEYAGSSLTETFADVVGYYVGRCALDNPYDTGRYEAYYEFAKDRIFNGKEFGPAAGEKPNCTVPEAGAEDPQPGAPSPTTPSWVEAVAGE